jgi:hypothetical protein
MSPDPLGLGRYLLDDEPARLNAAWTAQLAASRPIPTYGSPQWLRAPRHLQIAACLQAAEARRRDLLFIGQAIADDLAAEHWTAAQQDQAEFERIAAGVRAMANQPTHAQLVARRAVVRRPGREVA